MTKFEEQNLHGSNLKCFGQCQATWLVFMSWLDFETMVLIQGYGKLTMGKTIMEGVLREFLDVELFVSCQGSYV